MPEQYTTKGLRKLAEWLVFCLSIGWKKSDLDELEKIWWKARDRNGNLRQALTPEKKD